MKHTNLVCHFGSRTRAGSGLAVLTLLLMLAPLAASAAPGDRSADGVWSDLGDANQKALAASNRALMPTSYHVFRVDTAALERVLASAPQEKDVAAKNGAILSFPMPDGTYQRFAVVESPILGPEAQAMIPDMRTYLAQGLDDPAAVLRFDTGYWGFRAYGRTSGGTLWIDPWELGDHDNTISAWKHDFPAPLDKFECGVMEDAVPFSGGDNVFGADKALPLSGDQLHTYRMIPTLTGEYGAYFGGLFPALSAATTTINRINVIFEVDAAIRFVIPAWVAYDNPATDPFPSGSVITGTLLGQNQTVTDGFYAGSYDIGHILTQGGGGGLAGLSVACNNSYKAWGGTGSYAPVGDPFDVDYVAHEVGHQMGANHSFNGTTNACNGNRAAGRAFEPGSGTTVMAYAGICGAEDLQPHSDPYFHVASLEEIIGFRNSTSCQVITANGNTPPTAYAGEDRTIPRGTAFYVAGEGSDANGDALTYCWEQYDLGGASPPTDPYGPLFRSFNPDGAWWRYFPDFGQVLAGGSDPWEITPTVDRSLTLRLTVRDNRAGGGGVDDDDLELTVAGAPFAVTSPNGGESYVAGQPVTVTWDVGGSTATDVIIWLYNGSFMQLAYGTPNDGTEVVTMPCGVTSSFCRIWLDELTAASAGVHVYDVSNADFTLTDGLPDFEVAWGPGWGDRVVVNSAASADLPTSLTGDTATYMYWAVANWGAAWPCTGFEYHASLDDNLLYTHAGVSPDAGWGWYQGPLLPVVAGGRHTPWVLTDPNGLAPESNEANNGYARQWVWEPPTVAPETQQTRPRPPQGYAGQPYLPGTSTWYPNVDGLRLAPGGWWRGAAVSSTNPSQDNDIFLYAPSTGVENGFDYGYLAASVAGGAWTDVVVSNANNMGNPAYDVGLLNYNSQTTDFGFEYRQSDAVLFVGQEFVRDVAEGQMLRLEEMFLNLAGPTTITLELKSGEANQTLLLALMDPTFTEGALFTTPYQATADASGRALITFEATMSGYYGIGITRNAFEGTAPFRYTLRLMEGTSNPVSATPPELALPQVTRIEGVYPNPFNPQTKVQLALRATGPASVKVYDVQGRLVRTLVDGVLAAGRHELPWNGTDDGGRSVPSGVYFVRMVHADGVDQQRMSLVK